MSLGNIARSNALWSLLQQFSSQGINFVVIIFMTRMILPEDFGLMGMIYVFISIGVVLLEGGMTESLIRTKDPDTHDFSSVFYVNLISSIAVYALVYVSAPFIAKFYDQEVLTNIIRVFSLTFVISAFTAVQNAILVKELRFKRQIAIVIPALIISSIVGLTMAYHGYGVWSLVYMALVKAFLISVQLWFYASWKPTLSLQWGRVKHHFSFGYKIALMEILNSIFANIFNIFIGKNFAVAQVGYYTQANTLKQVPVSNIYGAINKVAYPIFSSIQDDAEKMLTVYRRMLLLMMFVLTPIMVCLIILAAPAITFLFTEKWLPALPYLQILCFAGILHPLVVFNMVIFKVKGRSDLYLYLGFINKLFIVIGIIATFKVGIIALLWSQVAAYFVSFLLNSFYLSRVMGYHFLKQLADLIPILLLNVFVGAVLYYVYGLLTSYGLGNFTVLLIGTTVSVLLYIVLSKMFKMNELIDLRSMVAHRSINFVNRRDQ
ncbi:lipopolysaccharide biosynthesis protein [Constantimarinum furrinae]|uniref:Polysaccharide biosynthesis protein CapK n=1 Tax=Constantimarinum furrinae TaxID=2562285 RepID=A0A7G8PX85_9FLAO|nr:lipopolysaccharide biosynthesis protein [Constantimarinum furrinae]QNJ98951.1 Polysaccharide biosynthesis protein CapK [Constantimarinum furrinae]